MSFIKNILRKLLGLSQRESWTLVAKQTNGKLKTSKLETDQVVWANEHFQMLMYITNKGKSAFYTRIECIVNLTEEYDLMEDESSTFNKENLEWNHFKSFQEFEEYHILYNFQGIKTEVAELVHTINRIKSHIQSLQNKSLIYIEKANH